ncbi:hypothetical protein JTE90_022899 [Oedothorax gibbosus]|uniref:DEP domain-containing protein n=1 Tax=Oedothorax gibbosus TaxID=931172 RepID=A0AAV6UT29_9ARAC|nr:hypothetical protein JTE90_022899 [Oedothorax gibbosus]
MFSRVTQIGAIYQIPPAIETLQWCKIIPDDLNITGSRVKEDDIDFDQLLPTLFECFAIVFCGFLAGRCNLISTTDIKGLNDFTTYFTLPPLIFLNLVTIDFRNVNWLFVLGILVGKLLVFLLVALVTVIVHRPCNLSYAGIYGIFCTQGNDFGLAYPIVASLYGMKRPLYPGYMYLIAPTSLLFLNPLGFILMEAQKNKDAEDCDVVKRPFYQTLFRTVGSVSWNILKNPVVFVTLLGVAGNFVFSSGLPSVLFGILQILSSAFSASVLFLLGFSVARTGESMYTKKEGLLIPTVLLITKMLVSPLISRSSVSTLCAGAPDVEDLADFGFLYGMVPTGPIVMLFAAEYGLRTEMMASTMVLCTGLFGPVVFVLARMLSLKVKGIEEFSDELRATMLVISILSFLSCVWIGLAFLISRKVKQRIYKITGCLILSQMLMSVGIFVWSLSWAHSEWSMYVQVAFISCGQIMSRVWVAVLAITMVCMRRYPGSPFLSSMLWPNCMGLGCPVFIVSMILIFTSMGKCEPELDKELPIFIYGTSEAVGSITILFLCLVTTSFCIVLYFRSPNNQVKKLSEADSEKIENWKNDFGITIEKEEKPGVLPTENDLISGAGIAIYKLTKSDPEDTATTQEKHSEKHPQTSCETTPENSPWKICGTMRRSETSFSGRHLLSPSSNSSSAESSPVHQGNSNPPPSEEETRIYLRHVILLILNCISMAVGLTISTWKLSTTQPNGLFVAIEFLDAVLNIGQGTFGFLVFIKDTKYIIAPISKWIRKVRHGVYSLNSSDDNIDAVLQKLCNQFCTYHFDNCKRDLPRTIRKGDQTFKNSFMGSEFVDWLMKVGLADHRTTAENYGQRLFRGGLLISVDGAVQFHDNNAYLYKLE